VNSDSVILFAVEAIGIIVAGFETTIGLIGNGTRALIEHLQQLALLRSKYANRYISVRRKNARPVY